MTKTLKDDLQGNNSPINNSYLSIFEEGSPIYSFKGLEKSAINNSITNIRGEYQDGTLFVEPLSKHLEDLRTEEAPYGHTTENF